MTDLINPTRRGFLGLMLGAVAAPVIVKATSLMPVRSLDVVRIPVDSPTGALAQAMIETKEVTAANILRGCHPMSSAAFRELLEPGLRKIFDKTYANRADDVFKSVS